MKKLILVTSPPASGKTFVTKKLAKAMTNCVYLDKDSLIVLSKQIFEVAGEENNRSSDFFEEHVRNYEYDAIMAVAYEALEYNDTVFINAPFTREIKNKEYMDNLRMELASRDTKLVVIWVHTTIDVCYQRMVDRNSDRDGWKLENWDAYVATRDFKKPEGIKDLVVFENSSEEEFQNSLHQISYYLSKL